MHLKHVLILVFALLISTGYSEEIKLTAIDPKSIKVENIDLNKAKNQFNINGLKGVIVKVYFREKYLKK